MAKNRLPAADVTEDPHYHDTWTLLRKYRDVVWSLEVSVRQVRNRFRIDYGKTIEDFLESVYLAGADLSGTELEHQAKCIEQSHKMLCLVDSAVDLMRAKHKNGEEFYWLLYYAYLSPQELQNVEEIIDQLRPHIRDISTRTYYRKRKEAVEAPKRAATEDAVMFFWLLLGKVASQQSNRSTNSGFSKLVIFENCS